MKTNRYLLNLEQQNTNITSDLIENNSKTQTINTHGFTKIHINEETITFDPITPTEPSLRDLTLFLKSSWASFQIQQLPGGDLVSSQSSIIGPTSCDSGDCSSSDAKPWINNLTYGLGFRCEGLDCNKDFSDKTNYRPATFSNQEPSVITRPAFTLNSTKFIFKINTPPSQNIQEYTTKIRFRNTPRL